jgi:hypothetical protein
MEKMRRKLLRATLNKMKIGISEVEKKLKWNAMPYTRDNRVELSRRKARSSELSESHRVILKGKHEEIKDLILRAKKKKWEKRRIERLTNRRIVRLRKEQDLKLNRKKYELIEYDKFIVKNYKGNFSNSRKTKKHKGKMNDSKMSKRSKSKSKRSKVRTKRTKSNRVRAVKGKTRSLKNSSLNIQSINPLNSRLSNIGKLSTVDLTRSLDDLRNDNIRKSRDMTIGGKVRSKGNGKMKNIGEKINIENYGENGISGAEKIGRGYSGRRGRFSGGGESRTVDDRDRGDQVKSKEDLRIEELRRINLREFNRGKVKKILKQIKGLTLFRPKSKKVEQTRKDRKGEKIIKQKIENIREKPAIELRPDRVDKNPKYDLLPVLGPDQQMSLPDLNCAPVCSGGGSSHQLRLISDTGIFCEDLGVGESGLRRVPFLKVRLAVLKERRDIVDLVYR